MAAMYRSHSLENEELMALYGEEHESFFREDDCISEEYELDSECSEGRTYGRGMNSSLSLEIYSSQKEGRERDIYFSNQEYYWRLEELKRAHLRNMAELERMYISQGKGSYGQNDEGALGRGTHEETKEVLSLMEDGAGFIPARRLQRINSQEELDLHETSSMSDQSDVCREDSLGELELGRTTGVFDEDRSFGRDMLLSQEGMIAQKQFRFQPKASCVKLQGKQSSHTGVRVRSNAKVTVPKPFEMMLREEERKRHRVRTRSEIELENTLLRRELEELRECRKKFRASPAPAHIHLPLYEVISQHSVQRPTTGTNKGKNNHRGGSMGNRGAKGCHVSPSNASLRPFSFIERERSKKEAKIVAELGNLAPKEEQRVFKARPMPSSVYGPRQRREQRSDAKTLSATSLAMTHHLLGSDTTDSHSDTNLELEPENCHSKPEVTSYKRGSRGPTAKPMKKQIELSIEMLKEREWSYIDPLKTSECNTYPSLQPSSTGYLLAKKSDYISA